MSERPRNQADIIELYDDASPELQRLLQRKLGSRAEAEEIMHDAFGAGWLQGGKMSVKLTNVLWVDEHVVARGKVREEVSEGEATRVHCDVWVEKDDETRVSLGTASALRP